MDNLIENIHDNYTLYQTLSMVGHSNKPEDFCLGDRVIVMNQIDSWSGNIKRGMVGNISNIMHRYKGRPAEHYEYWVTMFKIHGGVHERFELYNILKYDEVEKLIRDWKH